MLSFKIEMTPTQLSQIVLPPSTIWTSTDKWLGVEWYLWPVPTLSEDEELKRLLSRWGDPGIGRILWENDNLVYHPFDLITAFRLDEPTRQFIFGGETDVTMKDFMERRVFSIETLKILNVFTSLRLREWGVPWPDREYPSNLIGGSKWSS